MTYLFLQDPGKGGRPLQSSASNLTRRLAKAEALLLIKRLATSLKALGIKRGDRAMLFSTNHIFIPVANLGFIGSEAIFNQCQLCVYSV